jgi:peptidoglycan/LPS O-acetylase OafA/YrhL
LTGGYVGVDVFFVISGFLIARVIYQDISSGTYSVAKFYERRIRRIFPALFLVFFATLAGAFALRFPPEIGDVGRSTLSSIFFVSNVLFCKSASYFNGELEANPLLHTWSLSVEEQFYIVFPILVFALLSQTAAVKRYAFGSICLLSFCASAIQVHSNPNAAFYLVQYRAWELLIGCSLAASILPMPTTRIANEVISWLGLGAIIGAAMTYTNTTPFPGLAAALPCIGAAAIIYTGNSCNSSVYRLLSTPTLRFVGLISYSLYLWHWPLLVFYLDLYQYHYVGMIQLFAFAVLLSVVSWWFVERPFRLTPCRLGPRATLGAAFAVMIGTSGVAVSLASVSEAIRPMSSEAEKLLAFENREDPTMRRGTCFLASGSFSKFSADQCLRMAPGKRNVLIFGDSHAAHLWIGYQTSFPKINFMQATAAGCKPMIDTIGDKGCEDLVHYIYSSFLPANHVDTVVLSARWKAGDVKEAIASAKVLSKYAARVVISGPIEEFEQPLPRLLARAASSQVSLNKFADRFVLPEQKTTDRLFASAELPDRVSYVSVYGALCKPNCLVTVSSEIPLQFDYGHLTRAGSVFLARKLGPGELGEVGK